MVPAPDTDDEDAQAFWEGLLDDEPLVFVGGFWGGRAGGEGGGLVVFLLCLCSREPTEAVLRGGKGFEITVRFQRFLPPQVLLRRANIIASDWLFETLPWCPRDGPSARHFQKQFSMVPPQVLLRRANIVTDRASDWLFEIAWGRSDGFGGFGLRQRREIVTHLRLIPPQVLLSRINIVTDRISDWRFESVSARPEAFTDKTTVHYLPYLFHVHCH